MDLLSNSNSLHLLSENSFFLMSSTAFFVVVGWAWRNAKPYELPLPFPGWFKIWFLTLQIAGIIPPLIVLAEAGIGQNNATVSAIVLSYLLFLGLQILAESWSARRFQSLVFVMVPYLYIPFRVWQLYEGVQMLPFTENLAWVRLVLNFEIVLWILNYCLDLSQLPRLHHWTMQQPTFMREPAISLRSREDGVGR